MSKIKLFFFQKFGSTLEKVSESTISLSRLESMYSFASVERTKMQWTFQLENNKLNDESAAVLCPVLTWRLMIQILFKKLGAAHQI